MSQPYISIVLQFTENLKVLEQGKRDILSFFNKAPSSIEILHEANLKDALLKSQGEIIFLMNALLNVPLVEVLHFMAELQSNPTVDILIGKKKKTGEICDFKAYRKNVAQEIFKNNKPEESFQIKEMPVITTR